MENPYPEELTDETSGVKFPNPKHRAWQEGYEAGYDTCNEEWREWRTQNGN